MADLQISYLNNYLDILTVSSGIHYDLTDKMSLKCFLLNCD